MLQEPPLYLSGCLKRHQVEYYQLLSGTRAEDNWEPWVSFFLDGVTAAATETEPSVIEIATLVAGNHRRLFDSPKSGSTAYGLFEMLPIMLHFTVERARQKLVACFPTANATVKTLAELGIVTEMTGQRKNRSFGYQAYIELLTK